MPAEFQWTSLLGPFLQFVAASMAVGVAYKFGKIQAGIARQQADTAALAAQTARNKLKYELFERRLEMYDLVYKYIDTVMRARKIESNSDSEFLTAARPMGWLTDKTVVEYVHKTLRDRMIELSRVTTQLESRPFGPDSAQLVMIQSNLQMALYNEHEALARVFEPYLKLEH